MFRLIFAAFLLTSASTALWAEEPVEGLACIQSVKEVCVGLEESLERCVAERGDRLTDECRNLIKMYTSVMQTQAGPAVCVPDVKAACGGLEGEALYSCVSEKKAGFSKACQDFLATASEMPSHHHH